MSRFSFQERARRTMIAEHLRGRGIADPRVLAALARVPRERFVPPESEAEAYADRALPLACEQTISQPYMVARMTELLELTGGERVLEIGTGSGYQAAVLAELAVEVFTIERHKPLADSARAMLTELGYTNIHVHHGDGAQGLPQVAPFSAILITAAAAAVPPPLLEQLAEGGRLVAPVGPSGEQMLQVYRKREGKVSVEALFPCRFVPLIPGGLP